MIKLQTPIFRCFIYSRYQCSLILYLFLTQNGYAQNINLDLKISNAGPVSQTVTNMGHFGVGMTPFVMDRLQHHQMSCRYPGADGNEYGAWAIWIGAKKITQENIQPSKRVVLDHRQLNYEYKVIYVIARKKC